MFGAGWLVGKSREMMSQTCSSSSGCETWNTTGVPPYVSNLLRLCGWIAVTHTCMRHTHFSLSLTLPIGQELGQLIVRCKKKKSTVNLDIIFHIGTFLCLTK